MLSLLGRNCLRKAPTKSLFRRFLSHENSTTTDRVGFIGLGNMGLPMAMNLAKEEVSVLAYDTNPNVPTVKGIHMAQSVQEIGHDCTMIFTMLPGCDAVHHVMNLLKESMPKTPMRVLVDCSTVSPATSREWHTHWIEAGHAMLDSPVSGGVKGAKEGTLTFMVGCHHEDGLEKARPYLEIMGQRVIDCGKPGAGAATKLCNNLALATQMIGICEAMNLGEALEVDPVVLADVLNISTAKCWSSQVNNPHPAVGAAKSSPHGDKLPSSRDYQGGFGTKLMLKDLGLAVQAAEQTKVAVPLANASKELYRLADLRGMGDKDFGVMLQFLRGK